MHLLNGQDQKDNNYRMIRQMALYVKTATFPKKNGQIPHQTKGVKNETNTQI